MFPCLSDTEMQHFNVKRSGNIIVHNKATPSLMSDMGNKSSDSEVLR